MKKNSPINIVFFSSLLLVSLIALGVVPRQFAFLILFAYIWFIFSQPIKDSLLLFARSIPFFIALPITKSFDNFNTWRIISAAIFLKWIFLTDFKFFDNIKISKEKIRIWWKNYRFELLGVVLLALSCLSLLVSTDFIAGVKRVIYFVNLILVFIVASDLIRRDRAIFLPLCKNIVLGGVMVLAIAYLQYFSTYFINPVEVFHHWWGEQISKGLYGKDWSDIVMHSGNTWFSYTGGSLKLRMFSIFPDSHSFPLYLLMVLPALFALGKIKLDKDGKVFEKNRFLPWSLLVLILINLALILSCTRGIWVSVVFPAAFLAFLLYKKIGPKNVVLTAILSLVLFVFVFPVANLMFAIPQFGLDSAPGSPDILIERLKTATSVEETSNMGRIFIWKETIKSIFSSPIFGVGIGNFPVILSQNVSLTKAGSSAHNLFLNVGAEMGIFAMVVFLWFIFELLWSSWKLFKSSEDFSEKLFSFCVLVFLIWVFGYSLTDAALFDERAFLVFMLICAMVLGLKHNFENKKKIA